MDEHGSAVLLFGNDVREGARAAYERWHSGHHVPQRLTVRGILGAIRFRHAGAGGPEFLTFYRLAKAEILEGPAYRALIETPDAGTLAMRPNLRAPRRLVMRAGPVPAIPEGFAMVVEQAPADRPFPRTRWRAAVVIDGPLVTAQRNHPIMGGAELPAGHLRLVFAPAERLSEWTTPAGATRLGGIYQSLDRFGVDVGSLR
ncbi:MAG: hypothetical protein CTY25_06105 [Methylobacterium sp.]|nr:MAG: hypothetical protein CTY25_06105 [Methylobacterium sp.]